MCFLVCESIFTNYVFRIHLGHFWIILVGRLSFCFIWNNLTVPEFQEVLEVLAGMFYGFLVSSSDRKLILMLWHINLVTLVTVMFFFLFFLLFILTDSCYDYSCDLFFISARMCTMVSIFASAFCYDVFCDLRKRLFRF